MADTNNTNPYPTTGDDIPRRQREWTAQYGPPPTTTQPPMTPQTFIDPSITATGDPNPFPITTPLPPANPPGPFENHHVEALAASPPMFGNTNPAFPAPVPARPRTGLGDVLAARPMMMNTPRVGHAGPRMNPLTEFDPLVQQLLQRFRGRG